MISLARSPRGMEMGTLTFCPNANFFGTLTNFGLSAFMNGGSNVSTLNSLGNFTPVIVVFPLGLLPAIKKLPCGVSVILE